MLTRSRSCSPRCSFPSLQRGLFIIDPTGKVRSLTINDDQAGRNVDEVLRLVRAFQYSATHEGEVCPASWQPGSKTIKANPEGIKEYFKEQKDHKENKQEL